MRVLVAMSGGVDSAVAALRCLEAGDEVVGATMKLWGGVGDSGCCSLADTTDARRVCDQLGIEHHVFNFADVFERTVVAPYAASHAAGQTPNPCVECNRHLKFDAFATRARRLGFDAIATGHHARIVRSGSSARLARGRDRAKDQSYVLAVLAPEALERLVLPVGELTKEEVRARAKAAGLRVADKPDSQDVCFIASRTRPDARRAFLAERIELHEGELVDEEGRVLGRTDALELVTVGQRRGLRVTAPTRRYALAVELDARRVVVGSASSLLVDEVELASDRVVATPLPEGAPVLAQVAAHGTTRAARLFADRLVFDRPSRRVAPGQLVAWYVGDEVFGAAIAR